MSILRKFIAITLGALGWAIGWGVASHFIYSPGRIFLNYSPLQEIPEAIYIALTLKMAAFFTIGFLIAGIFTGLVLGLSKPGIGGKRITGVAVVWLLSATLVGGSLITVYRISHVHPLIDFPYNPIHFFQVFVSPLWMGILGVLGGLGTTWAAVLSGSDSQKSYLVNTVIWATALVIGALVARAIGRIEIPVMAFQNKDVIARYLAAPAVSGGLVASLIGHTGMIFFGQGKTD